MFYECGPLTYNIRSDNCMLEILTIMQHPIIVCLFVCAMCAQSVWFGMVYHHLRHIKKYIYCVCVCVCVCVLRTYDD